MTKRTTVRTIRQLPEAEQNMLRVVAELYARYGAEIVGYTREEIASKFGVSLPVVDALRAWHTINTHR